MKRIMVMISAMLMVMSLSAQVMALPQSQNSKQQSQDEDYLRNQIKVTKVWTPPKPEFDVLSYLTVEGMWRWDDKNPRFYSSFVDKIVKSLEEGPF